MIPIPRVGIYNRAGKSSQHCILFDSYQFVEISAMNLYCTRHSEFYLNTRNLQVPVDHSTPFNSKQRYHAFPSFGNTTNSVRKT